MYISDTALEIDPNDETKTVFCKLRHPKTGMSSVIFIHYLSILIIFKMKNNNQYFGHRCILDSLALSGVNWRTWQFSDD